MIFDRDMFNRLYFTWFLEVYSQNKEIAIEADRQVVPRVGKKMAQLIKEQIPGDTNTSDYMFNALKESHWFQEDVELVEKNDNYLVLQAKNCIFQEHWLKNTGELLYCCTGSHGRFLEEFCKEINPISKVENLRGPTENPKDNVYCKWKISINTK
ncbi:MAG: hypothetical protein Q7S33_01245 [Nanoarchaeota archaeon]|nr:hypothetical protein [Nanoarchaeota archaeon]